MKKLIVFEVITGEWCAGTSTLNQVWAPTKEEAVALWKQKNPETKVRIDKRQR